MNCPRLFMVLFFAFVAGADDGDGILQKITDATTIKKSSFLCGLKPCPEAGLFHRYECCTTGDSILPLTECCFRLQTWVIVVLAVIGVIVLASVVLSLIRCVFCRR